MQDSPTLEHVVWDSCVAIDAVQQTRARWTKIEPFVRDAEAGKIKIVISEITVVEMRHLPELTAKGVSTARQARLIRDWLENPYIVRRPVHPGISDLACDLARTHNIKRAADATIVATAVFDGIGVLHTFDGPLLSLDGKIGNPPLRIMEPDKYAGTMFEHL